MEKRKKKQMGLSGVWNNCLWGFIKDTIDLVGKSRIACPAKLGV